MIGLLYVIIAEFLWGWEFILIRKFFPNQNPVFISAVTSLIGSAFYLPAFVFLRQKLTVTEWIVLVVLGVSSWFLAQVFYVSGIQKGTSAFALAMASLTLPLTAGFLGRIILKEPMTWRMIIGGGTMMVGFVILST